MKEKERKNIKVYHICDGSDISTMKNLEEEEKSRVSNITYSIGLSKMSDTSREEALTEDNALL